MFLDSQLLVGKAVGTIFTRERNTEPYVCIPPALIITDFSGATWTLGFRSLPAMPMFYNVLRDDIDTGEYAEKIEYLRGQVRIWTVLGRKTWRERLSNHMSTTPGYFV
jgi:hypothetical protein